MTKTAIVIFQDDFRIKDNPAFFHACKNYENIIPIFIFDEFYQGRKIGNASKVFLHHTLIAFDKLLKEKYGINLVLKKGNILSEVEKIINQEKIDAIYFNRSYSKTEIATQEKIFEKFKNQEVKSFKAKILFEKDEIKNQQGQYFKVFTPFFKEIMKNLNLIDDFLKAPNSANSKHKIQSLKIQELELLPKIQGNWDKKLIKFWEFDYDKIDENISLFLQNKLKDYKENRNRTDLEATSNLSPYFRFGIISVKIVFLSALNYEFNNHFLSEICWREFSYHIYNFNQEITNQEIKSEFKKFQWQGSDQEFKKWQKGETGFDIVDASMKEIYATGIMHNRARMISASFLIKDLLIDWKKGEEYFWDCLVDADFAVNPFSWQWVFGSGFDAAPYFRIFNPELQEKKFDPHHKYCDKWLDSRILTNKIVNHDERRKIALEKYKICKQ